MRELPALPGRGSPPTRPRVSIDRTGPRWVFHGRRVLLARAWLADGGGHRTDPRPRELPLSGRDDSIDMLVPMGSAASVDAPRPAVPHDVAHSILDTDAPPPPDGFEWVDLRVAASAMSDALFRRAGWAWQFLEWRRTHRYCGVCGSPTTHRSEALGCDDCDHLSFPRLSPAVIVLVHDGDRALLGRGRHLPEGMYSTLAGFVEPGESLEQAVHREIREEADIEVGDLRYYSSQPWPFPHSLMVGFFARYAGGNARPADGELDDVAWFTRDDLPRIPGRVSIARSLIDTWAGGELP